jgi:hypothetical protein
MVRAEATGRDKEEEIKRKKKRKEKEKEKEKKGKRGKREIKNEMFYLFLEIVIHKFYFAYYCYIMKNRI